MPAQTRPASTDKKYLILSAARRLLVRRGFQDIVLDEVAREAGVAKGTLFLYYRSKDELFAAAFADFVEQLGASLDDLLGSGKSGKELLRGTIRVILDHFHRNRDFISQFGAGKFPGCGERSCGRLMGKLTKNMGRMVDILERCADAGVFPAKNLDLAAVSLFALCRSSIFHRLLTGREHPLAARTEYVMDMFLHGVRGKR